MPAAVPADDSPRELHGDTVSSVLRLLFGFALFLGAITLLAWAFHPQLQRIGHWFIERFGIFGMVVGTFLADGFHFPVPPQFYLLTAVAGGADPVGSVVGVLAGSVLGGLAAFAIGQRVAGFEVVSRWARAPRVLLRRLLAKHGNWGLVVAGLLPLSYWLLCSASGLLRLPYRAYGIIALMRIPRIVVSYLLVLLAWGVAPS